jgi:hypothetical protein
MELQGQCRQELTSIVSGIYQVIGVEGAECANSEEMRTRDASELRFLTTAVPLVMAEFDSVLGDISCFNHDLVVQDTLWLKAYNFVLAHFGFSHFQSGSNFVQPQLFLHFNSISSLAPSFLLAKSSGDLVKVSSTIAVIGNS